jgi:hypothetical protein
MLIPPLPPWVKRDRDKTDCKYGQRFIRVLQRDDTP